MKKYIGGIILIGIIIGLISYSLYKPGNQENISDNVLEENIKNKGDAADLDF